MPGKVSANLAFFRKTIDTPAAMMVTNVRQGRPNMGTASKNRPGLMPAMDNSINDRDGRAEGQ